MMMILEIGYDYMIILCVQKVFVTKSKLQSLFSAILLDIQIMIHSKYLLLLWTYQNHLYSNSLTQKSILIKFYELKKNGT